MLEDLPSLGAWVTRSASSASASTKSGRSSLIAATVTRVLVLLLTMAVNAWQHDSSDSFSSQLEAALSHLSKRIPSWPAHLPCCNQPGESFCADHCFYLGVQNSNNHRSLEDSVQTNTRGSVLCTQQLPGVQDPTRTSLVRCCQTHAPPYKMSC